jgi:spore maturation protein CgeB
MKIVFFAHSLLSDWNHGNAHFLRGLATELGCMGHEVRVYEPRDGWSITHLIADHGEAPLAEVRFAYPTLRVTRYDRLDFDVDRALAGADLVIVHEWSEPRLVALVGRKRSRGGRFRLLFHDTHHRAVTAPDEMVRYDLSGYDGVLAFGEAIRRIYLNEGWARRVFTFHEAADTRVFRPLAKARGGALPPGAAAAARPVDLVWVGNFGDAERTRELETFLVEPVSSLGLEARVYGVRYPAEALASLSRARIEYGGWLPNYRVPEAFARARVTVHVPRRPYARALPGIPTIRPFEALACGIPLVSAPWDDAEGLFRPGEDFLVARTGAEMKRHLRAVLEDSALAESLRLEGRRTVLARHTCAHRAAQLLEIARALGAISSVSAPESRAEGA